MAKYIAGGNLGPYARGAHCDAFTYMGMSKSIVIISIFWFFLYNIEHIMEAIYGVAGVEVVVHPDSSVFRKIWSSVLCFSGIVHNFIHIVRLILQRRGFKISPDILWDEWELHQQWKQRQQAEAKRWKKRIKIELHEPEEEPAPPAVPAEPVDVPISSEHEIRLPGMDEGVMRETGALPMRLEVPAGQDATASPKLVGHYHSGTNRIVLARKHQGRASSKGWHRGGQCRGAGKSPVAAGRKKGPRGVRAKRNTTDQSRSYCRKKGKELSWPGRRCRPWRSGHPDWT